MKTLNNLKSIAKGLETDCFPYKHISILSIYTSGYFSLLISEVPSMNSGLCDF